MESELLRAAQPDFFVSHVAADRQWAEWICWQLADAGYTVHSHVWQGVAGTTRAAVADQSLREAHRTLVVLSQAYLRSAFAGDEWRAAFFADPRGTTRKLVPVRVEACRRPLLLRQVVTVDVFGVGEGEARRRLLVGAQGARTGRAKPTSAPGFPGSSPSPGVVASTASVTGATAVRARFPGPPRRPRYSSPLLPADPRVLGGYPVVARLGSGGMGVVYLGESPRGEWVAVKTMSTELARDDRFRSRFAREVTNAGRFSGSHSPAVLDADLNHSPPYLVAEFVDGPDLNREVRERGPLPASEVRRLALALLDAIISMHEAGIVHRDIKPSNIILSRNGPYLIDFGISRSAEDLVEITARGEQVGTPALMAPEQWTDDPVPASDLFAWAGVVVFASTGRWAFRGETSAHIRQSVLNDQPDLDGVETSLGAILERAFQKDPARRPEPRELRDALSQMSTVGQAGALGRGALGRSSGRFGHGSRARRKVPWPGIRGFPTATSGVLLLETAAGIAVAGFRPPSQFVVLPFPLLLLAALAWDVRVLRRRPAARPGEQPASGYVLADRLALRMRDDRGPAGWAGIRSGPDKLPVNWSVTEAAEGLSEPWETITRRAGRHAPRTPGFAARIRHLTPATGFGDLAGEDDLLPTLFRVPTRRLVVLGPPGSGRSTLAGAAAGRLLAGRDSGDPVPVIAHATRFSSDGTSTGDALNRWLALSVVRQFPQLAAAGDYRSGPAHLLVESRRIVPVVDGLDQLPAARLAEILRAVEDGWPIGQPIVLLCTTEAYRAAIRQRRARARPLKGAAVVEIGPPAPDDVSEWFLASARVDTPQAAGQAPPAAPAPPAAVAALAAELARNPGSPLCEALRSALTADLLREKLLIAPAGPAGRLVRQLCDQRRFPTRQDVAAHVLANSATGPGAGRVPPVHWPAGPLGWWELDVLVPRGLQQVLLGSLLGLVCAAAVGDLLLGTVLGAAAGLASGRALCPRAVWPSGRHGGIRGEALAAVGAASAVGCLVGLAGGALLFLAASALSALVDVESYLHDNDAASGLLGYLRQTGWSLAALGTTAGLWWWFTSPPGRHGVARGWNVIAGRLRRAPATRRPGPGGTVRMRGPAWAGILLLAAPALVVLAYATGHEDACDGMRGRRQRALELFGAEQWETVRIWRGQGHVISLRFDPVRSCVWAHIGPVEGKAIAWLERAGIGQLDENPRMLGRKTVEGSTYLASYPLLPGTEFRVCLSPGGSRSATGCTRPFAGPSQPGYRNLIQNSGFEEPSPDRAPPPWWRARKGTRVAGVSGGFGGGGEVDVQFGPGSTGSGWVQAGQTVRAQPGRFYVLRAYAEPEAGAALGCVGVRAVATGELLAAFVFDMPPENDPFYWKVAVEVPAVPAGELEVFVGGSGRGGVISFDEVTFSTYPLDETERRDVAERGSPLNATPLAQRAGHCGG